MNKQGINLSFIAESATAMMNFEKLDYTESYFRVATLMQEYSLKEVEEILISMNLEWSDGEKKSLIEESRSTEEDKESELSNLRDKMASLIERMVPITKQEIGIVNKELFVPEEEFWNQQSIAMEILAKEMTELQLRIKHIEETLIPKTDWRFTLCEDVTKSVLTSFRNLEELREFLNEMPSSAKRPFNYFQKLISGEKIDPNDLDLNSLVAYHEAVALLAPLKLELPTEESLKAIIKLKERLVPFYEMTNHFAGRTQELKQLKNYVDFIPNTSFLDKARKFISNTFSWGSHPPLMVTGVGGVGKSTLIAKFILDHLNYQNKGQLPLVYLDFDKPGLSLANIMLLFVEALRQIRIQFPTAADWLEKVSRRIKDEYLSGTSMESNGREMDQIEVLNRLSEEFKIDAETKILVVFDSFEEIQSRATSAELRTLFNFLKVLNQYIPRLKCVFVGRAEVMFEEITFEHIKLGNFDRESALGFLAGRGITNRKISEIIFDKFGGNPLTMNLIVNVLQNEKLPNEQLNSIEVSKYFFKIDESRIQHELVKRNLDHIVDVRVKQVAVPGILVRIINPEIIKEVLAGPCGLGEITLEQSLTIFQALTKQKFLIQQDGENLCFRQDLRIALRDLIIKDNPEKAMQIHNAAIDYYLKRADEESGSEAVYHMLMRGCGIKEIESYYRPYMRPYLERSFIEFPESSRIAIAGILNLHVNKNSYEQSSQDDWERLMINEIKDTFLKGDEKELAQVQLRLQTRKERSTDTNLFYYQAKLFIRLGLFEQAARTLKESRYARELGREDNIFIVVGTILLQSRLFEYQKDYRSAISILNSAVSAALNFDILNDEEGLLVDFFCSHLRLSCRVGVDDHRYRGIIVEMLSNLNSDHFRMPKMYRHLLETRRDQKDNSSFVDKFISMCWEGNQFSEFLTTLEVKYPTLIELDRFLSSEWKIKLKDITEPGESKLLYFDVLLFLEQMGFEKLKN